jgi:hypothetical protein
MYEKFLKQKVAKNDYISLGYFIFSKKLPNESPKAAKLTKKSPNLVTMAGRYPLKVFTSTICDKLVCFLF